jgi:hypothetical protein
MNAPNGHAQKDRALASGPPPAMLAPGVFQVPAERVKELVAALEVPFDPSQIEWRVMNTTKNQQPKADLYISFAVAPSVLVGRRGKTFRSRRPLTQRQIQWAVVGWPNHVGRRQ